MQIEPVVSAQLPRRDLKVTILLVDDKPANLLALDAILGDLNQELIHAQSGEEALQFFEEHDAALVLLDAQLPGLSGFETARRMREREQTRHTPIIFLTAHSEDEFPAAEAYQLGAVDYLVKPLQPSILHAKVAALVDLAAEKERAKREAAQLRLLVDGTTDYAIFLLDREGCIATWNVGAKRLKGYAAEEIIGQHFSRFYPKDMVERGWPEEELRRATAVGRFEDEGWRVRKDGSTFWANVIITALKDETGRLQGFSKVTRDLTERRRAEEDLRRARDQLEANVAERTRELTDANARLATAIAQLADAARRKDDFLAMLAHELRNPLAPVLNSLQIMRLSRADQNVINQAREMIERQIRHLSRLVDDLLDISRITQGRIQIRHEHLDLVGLIRTTAEDHRPEIEQAGMRLDLDLPETPVWIIGDPTRLAQVLNNLLDNAVKFSDGGDLVVVRLTTDINGDEAVIEVQDNGMGIEAELFPRLFNAFEQADHSLDRSRGGLGIGLSVVRGLVRLHGGDITATSGGRGQGATFVIRLPLKNESPAPGVLSTTPDMPIHEPLRILIVEDNRDAANSLRTLLELLGHQARVAYSGPDGVQVARAWRPDVVLCDIGLPGLDGYGVAGQLRQDPATAHASLIAITGYGQDEDKIRSHQAGFDHHLVKPVDAAILQPLLTRTA